MYKFLISIILILKLFTSFAAELNKPLIIAPVEKLPHVVKMHFLEFYSGSVKDIALLSSVDKATNISFKNRYLIDKLIKINKDCGLQYAVVASHEKILREHLNNLAPHEFEKLSKYFLDIAIKSNNINVVKFLFDLIANKNKEFDEDNFDIKDFAFNSLLTAGSVGNIEIADYLLKQASSKSPAFNEADILNNFMIYMTFDPFGLTPLDHALINNKMRFFEKYCSNLSSDLNKYLKLAVSKLCDVTTIDWLLYKIASLKLSIKHDLQRILIPMAISVAADKNSAQEVNKCEQIVKFLIDKGFKFDATINGLSCLHQACRAGSLNLAKLMIDLSYTQIHDVEDSSKNNCLHHASISLNIDLVHYLLKLGLSPINRNANWQTPLIYLFSEIDSNTDQDKVIELCKILLNRENVNEKDYLGETILHYAIRNNLVKIISFILSFNPDLESRNNDDETPMSLAKDPDCDPEILKLLIDHLSLI